MNGAFGKARNANFRALQVAEGGDTAAQALGDLADSVEAFAMIIGRPMGEVEAHHVNACF